MKAAITVFLRCGYIVFSLFDIQFRNVSKKLFDFFDIVPERGDNSKPENIVDILFDALNIEFTALS